MNKKNTDTERFLVFIKEHYLLLIALSSLFFSFTGYIYEYFLLKSFDLNIVVFAEIEDFLLAGIKNWIAIITFPFIAIFIGFGLFLYNQLQIVGMRIFETEIRTGELINKAESFSLLKEKNIIGYIGLIYITLFKKNEKKIFYELKNQIKKDIEDQRVKLASLKKRHVSLRKTVPIKLIKINLLFWFFLIGGFYFELESQIKNIKVNPKTKAIVQLNNKITLPNSVSSNHPLVFITATKKYMFFYQHGLNKEASVISIPISSISKIQFSKIKI